MAYNRPLLNTPNNIHECRCKFPERSRNKLKLWTNKIKYIAPCVCHCWKVVKLRNRGKFNLYPYAADKSLLKKNDSQRNSIIIYFYRILIFKIVLICNIKINFKKCKTTV